MDRWSWLLDNVGIQEIRIDTHILRQMEDQRRIEVVAQEIRDMRKARGLSQSELAKKVGTTQPSLARFEAGRVPNVGYTYVRRLLEALGAV